jgi:hypothetical protein
MGETHGNIVAHDSRVGNDDTAGGSKDYLRLELESSATLVQLGRLPIFHNFEPELWRCANRRSDRRTCRREFVKECGVGARSEVRGINGGVVREGDRAARAFGTLTLGGPDEVNRTGRVLRKRPELETR